MMKSTVNWSGAKAALGFFFVLVLSVSNCFAAPASSNEDQIGFASPSRQVFRNHENNQPLLDYNIIPVVPESGIAVDAPQPMDLGIILSYLASRHSGLNRGILNDRNELARKRSSTSYSRYCAFNAVSCFGRR